MSEPVAVYVHIPFCPSKCGYCDFNSYAMSGGIIDRTVDAIEQEILASPWAGIPAKTIFFGGGTPTFIRAEQISRLLHALTQVHPPTQEIEITSEANPGTVDAEKFSAMREAGFNRISLGAQSFQDAELLSLGRVHHTGHIEKAVQAARSAGFASVNIDLMFALPGQSLKSWDYNLRRALDLGTDHLSLYGLTLEPNTAFYKRHLKGELVLPEDDLQVQMYDMAIDLTSQAGFLQYEISNFAKPGFECAHNLCYWHNEPYAGYGPGAVGFMPTQEQKLRRYTNIKHPERYSVAVENAEPVWFEDEILTSEAVRLEKVMLGLRLQEGLTKDEVALDRSKLTDLVQRGWVAESSDRITLTAAGRHFCSEVVLALA